MAVWYVLPIMSLKNCILSLLHKTSENGFVFLYILWGCSKINTVKKVYLIFHQMNERPAEHVQGALFYWEWSKRKKKRERERSLNTLVKVTGPGNVVLSPVFILWSLFLIGVKLLYNVVLVYTMWISYIYSVCVCVCVYIPSLLLDLLPTPHPPSLGHHRSPSWAPSAIQLFPTSYLFYICQCIYVNPNLPFHLTLSSPLCPHVHSLCLHLFPALQIGLLLAFFLDYTYMH